MNTLSPLSPYTGKLASIKADYLDDPEILLALCIWREARNQPYKTMQGVAEVVLNRCRMAPAQGFHKDVAGNILKPWAFTSFMEGDGNCEKYPVPGAVWENCKKAARFTAGVSGVSGMLTGGAVFYHDSTIPGPRKAWGNVIKTVQLNELLFYKIV